MFVKQCPCCGHNLGINYYVDNDGKPNHIICKNCREEKRKATFY